MRSSFNKARFVFVCAAALCLALVPVSGFASSASQNADAKNFAKKLEPLLNNVCLKKGNYGIQFHSLDRDQILFEKNGDRLLTPASNMKLATTATVLKELGTNYRFQTRLYTQGKLVDGVLKGDLYIKGFGDPKLVSEQMWLLTNAVSHLPLRRVEGDIVADDSFFDSESRIEAWEKEFGSEPYNAPLGALSFNFNTVTVYTWPGARVGEKPKARIDPGTDYIHVTNGATTSRSRKKNKLEVDRVDRDGFDEITLTGVVPLNETRSRYYLNITEPTRYTAQVFKEYLAKSGIETTGKVRADRVPERAELLLTHESDRLSQIVRGLNKYSNNFMAEQVLKTAAAEKSGPPGTTAGGIQLMQNYMRGLGFLPDEYNFADGSGLSRQNRLSPRQIVAILASVYRDWTVFPEYVSALAEMGGEGSLEERMTDLKEAKTVRAKTGTLNGVSALSGYLQTKDGERLAFSILMNDLRCSNDRAQKLQDRILREALLFRAGTK